MKGPSYPGFRIQPVESERGWARALRDGVPSRPHPIQARRARSMNTDWARNSDFAFLGRRRL